MADRKKMQNDAESDDSIDDLLEDSSTEKPSMKHHETEQIVVGNNIQREEILSMKKMRAFYQYKWYELELLLLKKGKDEKAKPEYFSGERPIKTEPESDEDIFCIGEVFTTVPNLPF